MQFSCALAAGDIPNSAQHLTFGVFFRQRIQPLLYGVIPMGVTHLTFESEFNITAADLTRREIIPSSVIQLTLPSQWRNMPLQVSRQCDVWYR